MDEVVLPFLITRMEMKFKFKKCFFVCVVLFEFQTGSREGEATG